MPEWNNKLQEELMDHDSRKQLEDIKFLLRSNRDLIKPMFGLMFWQLNDVEARMSAEQFGEQGMNLAMTDDGDEVIASFIASYIKLWESAKDLNAASRFIADCLEMSADELLQTRQVYLDRNSGVV